MSQTFALVCDETQRYVWVGQGWRKMTTFYSGMPDTMATLKQFLVDHIGKSLEFVCIDTTYTLSDYGEYEVRDDKIVVTLDEVIIEERGSFTNIAAPINQNLHTS